MRPLALVVLLGSATLLSVGALCACESLTGINDFSVVAQTKSSDSGSEAEAATGDSTAAEDVLSDEDASPEDAEGDGQAGDL